MENLTKLAIHGGTPSRTRKTPPAFPGGMAMDELEEQAVLEVLRSKRLFRYYGPFPTVSQVEEFEKEFAAVTGTRYTLGLNSCTNALVIALLAAGVQPGMGSRNVPDWHIYCFWDHILSRRGNNDSGYPFTLSDRRYDREMCPKTLDLLERMIHVEISPLLTDEDVDETIVGLQKVLGQMA